MDKENFNNHLHDIREFLREQRFALYPVENGRLKAADEYTKSLYLRVLAMLIQCRAVPDSSQTAYLKRLVAGCGYARTAEQVMRDALELAQTDIQEFLRIFRGNDLRYYFCIDGMILAAAGEDDIYELLAELVEALGIQQEELDYLAIAARAILEQDGSKLKNAVPYHTMPPLDFRFYGKAFQEEKKSVKHGSEHAQGEDLSVNIKSAGYVKKRAEELIYLMNEFSIVVVGREPELFQDSDIAAKLGFVYETHMHYRYASLIAGENEIRHYYPIGKKDRENYSDPRTEFSKLKAVIFENIEIDITANWYFTDCSKVKFVNCGIHGKEKGKRIYVRNVGSLEFSHCKISGFTHRFLEISRVSNKTGPSVAIEGNTFQDCGYKMSQGPGAGGVFYISVKQAQFEEISLKNNLIKNCYVKANKIKTASKVSGVFLAGILGEPAHTKRLALKGNKFDGCRCENNGEGNDALIESLAGNRIEKEGNTCNTNLVLMGE